MRKRYNNGFHVGTGRNRSGFTRADCVKGGEVCKGWESEEEARQRALIDAKGLVLRHGVTYSAKYPNGLPWLKRRAREGRTNQIEILLNGKIYRTTGETKLTGKLAFLRGRNGQPPKRPDFHKPLRDPVASNPTV